MKISDASDEQKEKGFESVVILESNDLALIERIEEDVVSFAIENGATIIEGNEILVLLEVKDEQLIVNSDQVAEEVDDLINLIF